jgi:hypothetical protein
VSLRVVIATNAKSYKAGQGFKCPIERMILSNSRALSYSDLYSLCDVGYEPRMMYRRKEGEQDQTGASASASASAS